MYAPFIRRFVCGTLFLLLLSSRANAEALRYTLNGVDTVGYQFVIRMTLPGGTTEVMSGTIFYTVAPHAPGAKQLSLGYSWTGKKVQVKKEDEDKPWTNFPPLPQLPPAFGGPRGNAPEFVINEFGRIVRTENIAKTEIIDFLGPVMTVMFPPLSPEGANEWVADDEGQYDMKLPDNIGGTVKMATKTVVNFNVASTSGNLVKIDRRTKVTSSDVNGGPTKVNVSGLAHFVFDKERGLMQSAEEIMGFEYTTVNLTAKAPVTINIRLLDDEELANMKAEREAAIALAKENAERAQAAAALLRKYDVRELPAGTSRGIYAGSPVGQEFIRVDGALPALIGVKAVTGPWGGSTVIRNVMPVYERPADATVGPNEVLAIAKDGYAVGGFLVNINDEGFMQGLRVVFAKLIDDDKTDPKDIYLSDWIVAPKGDNHVQLGVKGDPVFGFYVKSGLNTHGIGLVVKGVSSQGGSPAVTTGAPRNSRDVNDIPPGTMKTAMIGGSGGGPFIRVNQSLTPAIGARVGLTTWMGEPQLKNVELLFEPPARPLKSKDVVEVIAKEGYVLSGFVVSGQTYSQSCKLIFVRVKDGKTDPTDTYTSDRCGEIGDPTETQLAGKGEQVVGLYGLQGLNLNGFGLVVLPVDAPAKLPEPKVLNKEIEATLKAADEADLKKVEAGWQKNAARPTELLHTMKRGTRDRQGRPPVAPAPAAPTEKSTDLKVELAQGETLATTASFRAPVTFRILLKPDGKDLRLAFAADQVIFNWEMRPTELRLDGGPANGQHVPGAGALPAGQWAGIEWIVKPTEMILYVNGEERSRTKGDFTKINKPLTITSYGGETTVKSVMIVR
jgi:hypothetical protein